MKLSERGKVTLGILVFIMFVVVISKMPNAEPEPKSDGTFYVVNHVTGDYNER